ncbi:MAG: DEAD/DEAH box helicase [Pirellulales bacterium]|nr:DEAD/DEAH box helicase [Pirellulales bacterium]
MQSATSTSETARQSWLSWVWFGATPKQRELQTQAVDIAWNLKHLRSQLADVRASSEQAIQEAVADLREQVIASALQEMPVERLKDLTKSVRVRLLESHGFCTIADLRGVSSARLQQIHGIGPASAVQIVQAVSQLQAILQNQRLELPPPSEIGPEHAAVLRATYRRIRCRDVTPGILAELQSAVSDFNEPLRKTKRAGGWWNRILNRDNTQRQVNSDFDGLSCLVESSQYQDLSIRAQALLESLDPPASISAVVDDYRSRYADYFAILDRYLDAKPQIGTNGEMSHRGPHGGVPDQIAEAVEAMVLSLDSLRVDLRGYQEFGAKYMIHQQRTVLGDEMGLGKTIQALAVITHLRNTEEASHFLIVCPASIVGNWTREINNRTDIPLRLVHGDGRDNTFRQWQRDGGIALTSYETLRSLDDLTRTPIHFLVADEAHYIKNPQAQRSINVKRLTSISDRLALMTGTALENHPREFVNLIGVCNDTLGRTLAAETGNSFGTALGAKRFEKMVSAAYLRRNQEDVLHELPEAIEVDEWVELEDHDRSHYLRAVESRNVMAMRQAANGHVVNSAKLARLDELISQYRDDGRKIVIFSFFLRSLDLVGELLGTHFRIDGSVPAHQRNQVIDGFFQSEGFAPLICQITAGGVGINLQCASVVVLLEPQYKPTSEWQAIKRVHRMGQSNPVVVHRFLARDTVDESLRALVGRKTALFNDYARESAIKDASPAATDTTDAALTRQLLEIELARRSTVKAG